MPTTTDDLTVKIVVDPSGAVHGFKTANDEFLKLAGSSKTVEGSLGGLEGALGKIAIGTISLNEGIELLKKAYEVIVEPLKEVTAAFAKQQQAEESLSASLKLVGQFSEGAVQNFKAFGEEMSRTTAYSEDTVTHLASIAKQMGLSDDMTKKLITTSADLAATNGEDLTASFSKLQASLKGNARALEDVAPELKRFTELQNQGGAAIDYLSKKLAGRAGADAKTLAGSMKVLDNAVEKLKATIGAGLDKLFDFGAGVQTKIAIVRQVTAAIEEFSDRVVQVKNAVKGTIDFEDLAGSLKRVGAAVAGFLLAANLPALLGMLTTIGLMALQWAAVAVAVVAAAAALDIFMRNLDRLPDLAAVIGGSFVAVFQKFQMMALKAFSFVIDKVFGLVAAIDQAVGGDLGLEKMMESLNHLGGASADAFGSIAGGLKETANGIKQAGKDIDTGFIGQIMKAVDAVKKLQFGAEKVKIPKAPDTVGSPSGIISPEKMQAFKEQLGQLVIQNQALSNSIASASTSHLDDLEKQLELERAGLDLQAEKIRADKTITAEMQQQLLDQIELLKLKKGSETDKKKKEQGSFISQDDIKSIKDTFGQAFGGIFGQLSGMIGGMFTGIGTVMNVVSGVLDFVQKIIDFIPMILDKLANIFISLTDLPNKLAAGVQKLVTGFVNFVANFIPNLFNSVPRILNAIVTGMFDQFPKVLQKMLKEAPNIAMSVLNQLPNIIGRAVQGLIEDAPQILSILLGAMPRTIGVVFQGIIKLIPTLVRAIVMGVIAAVKDVTKILLGQGSGIKVDTSGIKKAGDDIAKTVKGVSDNVFKVIDFAAAAHGTTLADRIRDAIGSSVSRAADIFGQLWAALKAIWQWVKDHIMDPINKALLAVWQFVVDRVMTPLLAGLQSLWQFVVDKIIGPLVGGLKEVFSVFIDAMKAINTDLGKLGGLMAQSIKDSLSVLGDVAKPVIQGFKDAFAEVKTFFKDLLAGHVADAFKSVFDFFKTSLGGYVTAAFKNLGDLATTFKGLGGNVADGVVASMQNAVQFFKDIGGKIWEGLSKGLNDNIDAIKKIFTISIPGSSGGGGGVLGSVLSKVPGHAAGGMLYAAAGMFVAQGADQVPIMGQAGEFMQSKPAVDFYGKDFMEQVNARKFNPSSAGTTQVKNEYTVSLHLTPSKLDDDYVRSQLVPKLMKEIYRASNDGRAVINQKGLRS